MKINLPMAITAADSNKRTITGKIVTWNEQGNTSVGPTVFASNSIELKNVKLLLEHDRTRPIGKVMEFTETSDGIEATFKIANTMAGEDALVEASEGLRDGFSVGAMINEWTNEKGVMKITSASLEEVSLVTDPAIDSARVSEVAASENEAPKDSEPATADSDKPTEGEQVSDTTVPAPAEETVEAAKVQSVEAARPAFYTSPRLEFTKAKYLEASIRSKVFGDDTSRQYVLAADDSTTNNSGLIPTRQLTEVVNPLSNADRPMIDAISRGVLPDAGMTFEIPKITAVPTVGVEAEAATINETGMTNSFISVDVKKYAGAQTFSVELLDRSSPVFFDELVRQMEYAYAKATNIAVLGEVANNGVLNATATTEDAPGLVAYVSSAAAAIYKASLGFARNIVVSPEQWGKIMGYAETSGRPIFTAFNPQNAGGVVSPTSLRGNVLGLDLYVDRTITSPATGDYSMVCVNPESYTWYESSRFRLETSVVDTGLLTGQIKVAYYGYGAIATKVGAGANWFNKS
jgi:HK97 family phage major capsid protein/HK97 family phage prohead protease